MIVTVRVDGQAIARATEQKIEHLERGLLAGTSTTYRLEPVRGLNRRACVTVELDAGDRD